MPRVGLITPGFDHARSRYDSQYLQKQSAYNQSGASEKEQTDEKLCEVASIEKDNRNQGSA